MADRAKVSHLYMKGEALAQTLSQPGVDVPALLRQMPSLAPQMLPSLLSGGDVQIPFGEFVTALSAANDNVKAPMLQHVSSEPTVPAGTGPQSEAMNTPNDVSLPGQENAAKDVARPVTPGEQPATDGLKPGQISVAPGQNPIQAIRRHVTSQLRASGLPSTVAAATGTIVAIRAKIRAARLSMDPVDLYNEKPLQFAGADGGEAASGKKTLQQAMNAGVDLDQPVSIVSVQPRNWSGEPKAAKIAKFWRSVLSGQTIPVPGL